MNLTSKDLGCKRSVPDHRDMIRMYGAGEIPSNTNHSLVKYIHHVYDQVELGSCSSNVVCGAYRLELM